MRDLPSSSSSSQGWRIIFWHYIRYLRRHSVLWSGLVYIFSSLFSSSVMVHLVPMVDFFRSVFRFLLWVLLYIWCLSWQFFFLSMVDSSYLSQHIQLSIQFFIFLLQYFFSFRCLQRWYIWLIRPIYSSLERYFLSWERLHSISSECRSRIFMHLSCRNKISSSHSVSSSCSTRFFLPI